MTLIQRFQHINDTNARPIPALLAVDGSAYKKVEGKITRWSELRYRLSHVAQAHACVPHPLSHPIPDRCVAREVITPHHNDAAPSAVRPSAGRPAGVRGGLREPDGDPTRTR